MAPFGSLQFNIVELRGELQIRYTRHTGWVERILAPMLVPILAMIGWFCQKPFLIVSAGVLLMFVIVRWGWGHWRVLRVLPDRLISSADVWKNREFKLSNIETIQWLRADVWTENGEPEGLYISCSGRAKCVLPLTKEQAKAVTDAISRKFSNYPVNVPVPGSLWFEAPPDMTAFTLPAPLSLQTIRDSSAVSVAAGQSSAFHDDRFTEHNDKP